MTKPERMQNADLRARWVRIMKATGHPRISMELGEDLDAVASETERARASEEEKDEKLRAQGERIRDLEKANELANHLYNEEFMAREEKDKVIQALAEALVGARAALTQNKTYPADVTLALNIIGFALRAAGRGK